MQKGDTDLRPQIVQFVGLALATFAIVPIQASAPMVTTQPGFYRMMLGDLEIAGLNDGVVDYPTAKVLPGATPEQIKTSLSPMGLSDPVGMSYNGFLINRVGLDRHRHGWKIAGLSIPKACFSIRQCSPGAKLGVSVILAGRHKPDVTPA
jgi:hypothetical protein